MRRVLFAILLLVGFALPAFGQQRMPVAVGKNSDGKTIYTDYRDGDLRMAADPAPPQISITQEVVVDYQCVANPGNPPVGLDRLYCDSGTGQLTCLTSTGANCLNGGGAPGGPVTSVGLAGPTGIPISGSPVTSTGTLTWAMPTGWVLGDLLIGNGSNSVARLAAPTTPDNIPYQLISTPLGGATQEVFAKAGLAGDVVSGTTDTIPSVTRSPRTREYTSNSNVAVTVPDPGSTDFEGNPAFVTIVEGAGAVTFTPQTSAVINWCNGTVCFPGQTSFTMTTGQVGNWSSPDGGNWLVRVTSNGQNSGAPIFNNQLLSGGGVAWTGLLNFTVSAAVYNIVSTTYTSPQTNLTLSAADPTNPRIDVIAVNTSGAAVVITGTPAASPSAPSVDPTSQLALTFVTVAANATTPTLNNILVYDENTGTPTEWNCTPSSNFNCNSTNNPFHGTHDIEATTAVATNNVVLANTSTVNLSTYSTLVFNIRNKATWPNQKSLSICFKNGSTVVGNCIGFKNGVFGFNQTLTTAYQQIVIPLSAFSLGSTVVDRVTFTVVGGGGSIGFYLDWIQIQSALAGNGALNLQLQVNGQNTQQTANLADSGTVTFTKTDQNGTSTIKATAAAGGYTTIDNNGTAVTQRSTMNFIPAGSANVVAADNSGATRTDITISGVNGPAQPRVNNLNGLSVYTIPNSDNAARDVFGTVATAVTLPQAGQVSANSFVAHRFASNNGTCSSCVTSSFAQSAGDVLFVTAQGQQGGGGGISVGSVTDTAGDIFVPLATFNSNLAFNNMLYVYVAYNIAASGSNVVTMHISGGTYNTNFYVDEYTGLTVPLDHSTSFNQASINGPYGVTNNVSFSSELALLWDASSGDVNAGTCAPGATSLPWTARTTMQQHNVMCEQYLSGQASYSYSNSSNGAGNGTIYTADFGVTATTSYQAGWYVVVQNTSTLGKDIVVTPTTSNINGQTTLVVHAGQACWIMSDGTNYSATCVSVPNVQQNGTAGAAFTAYLADQTASHASIGSTAIYNPTGATTGTEYFEFAGYGDVTVVGTSCVGNTTVVLNIIYTDPATSSTTTLALGTWTITTNGTVGTTNFNWPPVFFKNKSAQTINFSTTYTAGGSCSPAPTVQITPILRVM